MTWQSHVTVWLKGSCNWREGKILLDLGEDLQMEESSASHLKVWEDKRPLFLTNGSIQIFEQAVLTILQVISSWDIYSPTTRYIEC